MLPARIYRRLTGFRPHRRLLIIAGVLLLICGAGLLSLATRLTPYARDRVVAILSDRFDSEVELDAFQVAIFPRLEIHGAGLVLRHHGRRDIPPLISIKSFSAGAGVLGLVGKRLHVASVTLAGLEINVPPERVRDRADSPWHSGVAAGRRREPSPLVDRIVSTNAHLVVAANDPGRLPRVFAIRDLTLHNLDLDRQTSFLASVVNPVPSGLVDASGTFGPWDPERPRTTPVKGSYTFTRADLNTIKGLGGVLSSKGNFRGVLERIDVNGETRTPDFSLDVAGQPLPLSTTFAATVDATTGDTWLRSVDARLGKSSITASGAIVRATDAKGRRVSLDVTVNGGRLEDLLRLALKSQRAPLTGAITATAKLMLPAGEADVSQRLRLEGRFALANARFSSDEIQSKVAELSQRGRGEPHAEGTTGKETVVSDLQGRFSLRDGVLSFPDLAFRVPGAQVKLAGSYTLGSEALDLTGHLLLDASLAQTTSGAKAALATLVQPLFHRPGGGTRIPIKVTGTREKPSFGVDIGKAITGR